MANEISPIIPVAAAPVVRSEKRTDTAQGDDARVVPPRQASDLEIVRRSDEELGDRARREFKEEIEAALNLEAQLLIDEYETTGDFVYRLINRQTGEQLRQWPREDMLKLEEFFRELDGLLVDKRV